MCLLQCDKGARADTEEQFRMIYREAQKKEALRAEAFLAAAVREVIVDASV